MGLIDHERTWHDLKRFIAAKPSHGAGALLAEMTRLELEHEIDEDLDRAVLRRFEAYLTDTFFGVLPPRATDSPLTAANPVGMGVAMGEGATPDQAPTEGAPACPLAPQTRLRGSHRAPYGPQDRPLTLAAAKS